MTASVLILASDSARQSIIASLAWTDPPLALRPVEDYESIIERVCRPESDVRLIITDDHKAAQRLAIELSGMDKSIPVLWWNGDGERLRAGMWRH